MPVRNKQRRPAADAGAGPIGAQRCVGLSPRLIVVGAPHHVEQFADGFGSAGGCAVDRQLRQVVAQYVLGVDLVHRLRTGDVDDAQRPQPRCVALDEVARG